MSTSSPLTAFHSNSRTISATKYPRCSMARSNAGQALLPAPKVSIFISFLQVISSPSPSPPGRNRSGLNSIGFDHTFEFQFISVTVTLTFVPRGIRYPSTRKCAGGCRRRPSMITALRKGSLPSTATGSPTSACRRSSSLWTPPARRR
ncbi:unnamed protein product [Spirodela intermedia]|uniref:Uncharacterized protein n=1 Tax=Spirodela intermedia TaxID=51605 RepID=A0A7I8L9W9_SPIIN|nr:unnamed protein product [Spirodela intermedia]